LVSVGHDPVIETQESESGLPLSLIPDSDGPLLRALVTRDGGTIAGARRSERGRAAIRKAIAAAADADVILVTGGTGFGSNDEAAAALVEIGELAMHGLALRPGGSAGIGRVGTALVLLLPGAPSSCLWAYEVLAGRAVRRLGGRDARLPYAVRSFTTSRKIVSAIGFTQICPVRRLGNDRVEPIASFDEAGLFAATMADGFVIVPESSEGLAQGATVEVYLLASGDVSQDPMVE
jgi:molybdopterin molybdotransferase